GGWRREVFGPDEASIARVLERDAAAKRAMAGAMSDVALFEAATNGLELRREPWMRRIVLLPQIAMRPWNILAAWDEIGIFCYSVADDSLGVDNAAPPAQMVRLYKALGDEKRLRMLKRLAAGPATLQELAEVAALAKSSAHHHTVILRSAGLIRVSAEQDSRYTLRREALPEASALLAAYLEEAR
ncbi:MAG TPA: helix-turn-helix domain-containing protein, partial [Actinomycetota bacterium]|nr:helix-turn-helix domain-containing protein [Actinomycetota bacterium]